MSDEKKLLAYVVETGDPEESTIIFATSNVAARREGANEVGYDFSDVSCKRLPWADEYAGKEIPAKAYIDNGWWMECFHCSVKVSNSATTENDDGEEVPLNPVFRKSVVFCCPACEAAHDKRLTDHQEEFEAFKAKVLQARPDLDFVEFKGEWPMITRVARFKFEGCLYGGSVRDQNGDGNLLWYVMQDDLPAWEAYEQKRKNSETVAV